LLGRLDKDPEATIPRCAFPILDKLLSHLTEDKPLDRVVLVATNQPGVVGTQRARDSLFTARILLKLIEHHYTKAVRATELVEYSGPLDPREAYRFFGALLMAQKKKLIDELHVSPSGGVPALNTALQQQAFRLCPEIYHLHQVVEVDPSEQGGDKPESRVLDVKGDAFLGDLLADIVVRLVKRWDYQGALDVISPYLPQLQTREVVSLLQHGVHRSGLDYKQALDTLPEGRDGYGRCALERAATGNPLVSAVEVFYLMVTQGSAGGLTDVLWQARAIFTATREVIYLPDGSQRYVENPKYKPLADLRKDPPYREIIRYANELLHEMHSSGRYPPWADESGVEEVAIRAARDYLKQWMWIDEQIYDLERNPYRKLNRAIRQTLEQKTPPTEGGEEG
jgi:hypothetical protein